MFGYDAGMAQRRHHYERGLESYLRARRVPYVAVNEAKKTLLPGGAAPTTHDGSGRRALKGFDFVIYGEDTNLLIEAKGRRLPRLRRKDGTPAKARLQSWVTREDVEALRTWGGLFGAGYEPAFVFVYWCDDAPPDGLFSEVFEHEGRWYTLRTLSLEDYETHMRTRSPKWGTVDLPSAAYERLWRRLVADTEPTMLRTGPDAAIEPVAWREHASAPALGGSAPRAGVALPHG